MVVSPVVFLFSVLLVLVHGTLVTDVCKESSFRDCGRAKGTYCVDPERPYCVGSLCSANDGAPREVDFEYFAYKECVRSVLHKWNIGVFHGAAGRWRGGVMG